MFKWRSKKTGYEVIIPLHPQVKGILEKRGSLLRNISDQKFNVHFKKVCQLVGIVKEVEGDLIDPKTRPKEEGDISNIPASKSKIPAARLLYHQSLSEAAQSLYYGNHDTQNGKAILDLHQNHPEGAW